jgi:tripartite-type tricarboxylate transporter receptor subunit TctC
MYEKKVSILVLVVILVCYFFIGYVSAQEKYPTKPIQALVPYAGGSITEVIVRVMSDCMQKYAGQPVIVINKPGAGGAIAGNELFKSKPDGYTIGVFHPGVPIAELGMNPQRFIYKSTDLQPVSQFSGYPSAIYVKNDAPWKTLGELIEDARKNPDKRTWGHHGRGSGFWIMGVQLMKVAGVKMRDVPFEGSGKSVPALLGGHVDVAWGTGVLAVEQVRAGALRALAVALKERDPAMPDVPTFAEAGYPIEAVGWYLGVFAPKGTPKEVIAKLDEYIKKITEDSEFQKKVGSLCLLVGGYKNTQDFEEVVQRDIQNQRRILKEHGIL